MPKILTQHNVLLEIAEEILNFEAEHGLRPTVVLISPEATECLRLSDMRDARLQPIAEIIQRQKRIRESKIVGEIDGVPLEKALAKGEGFKVCLT